MELKKRDCGIKIKLEPKGCNFLGIIFNFYGNEISFNPSSAVGGQFGDFLSALYTLYYENGEGHDDWKQRENHIEDGSNYIRAVSTTVDWDNEGEIMTIKMTKDYDENAHDINLKITTDYGETFKEFTVNDKDLCYAAAKACTEVLKEYGIYGYKHSTEYDSFNLNQLLFIKAYALDCYRARALIKVDELTEKTDFDKEVELLLFDM